MSTKQYLIALTSEFTIDAVKEISDFMCIPIDEAAINKVYLWEARCDTNAQEFTTFYDPDDKNNVCIQSPPSEGLNSCLILAWDSPIYPNEIGG